MSARVLQPSDLFAFEKQQWSDYRNNYAFTDQPFNFSSADLLPANQTPLLNANEADFLNQLFDHPPNAFDDSAYIEAELQKNLGLEYNWLLNEPPPTLQEVSGSAPSSAHPFTQPPAFTASASNQIIPASAAEDVLGAASALLGTQPAVQQHQRSPSLSISTQNLTHVVPSAVSSAYLPSATPTKTASPTPTLKQRRSPGSDSPQLVFNLKPWDEETDTILTPGLGATFDHTAHAGIPQRSEPRRAIPAHARTYSESHISSYYAQPPNFSSDETNRRLYRFGSDSHFRVNGYVRAPEEPSEEQLTQRMLDENFGAISAGFLSNTSTRAPSPSHGLRRIRCDVDDESEDGSPHKRRKANDDDDAAPFTRQTWRRRASTSLVSPVHRRRKSSPPNVTSAAIASSGSATPANKKAVRENLSEEQKRSNHIVSEQKRRNLIKVGFEELHNLVPGLREGGFSKSNVLMEASAYLESIIAGNQLLKARLGDLDLS